MDELITEEWLKQIGFKWHQLERQPSKHWVLWLGDVLRSKDRMFCSSDDLGVEVAAWMSRGEVEHWHCWLRSDVAHRYSRFIHIRHIKYRHELISLIEANRPSMEAGKLL